MGEKKKFLLFLCRTVIYIVLDDLSAVNLIMPGPHKRDIGKLPDQDRTPINAASDRGLQRLKFIKKL